MNKRVLFIIVAGLALPSLAFAAHQAGAFCGLFGCPFCP